MRIRYLTIGLMAALAVATAKDDEKPMFPPPTTTPKFSTVLVQVEHNPTVTPLEVESRLRWLTERELVDRGKQNFKSGKDGLILEIKFLHFIQPQEPFLPRRAPRTVPSPKGGGQILLGPEAEIQPIPRLGEARIELTFKGPDGTQLSRFDFVDSVPARHALLVDDQNSFLGRTAKIAAEYARHYFLEKSATDPNKR